MDATEALASLCRVSRLYINFFQPSFKLKSKTRQGARVTKRYETLLTPLERVLRSSAVPDTTKCAVREQFHALDPVDLLRRMREAQRRLAEYAATSTASGKKPSDEVPIADFLTSSSTARQDGEVRATHPGPATVSHHWRTRADPFEHTWPQIQRWLEKELGVTTKQLLDRLIEMAPALYSGAQMRTLQRWVKAWRSNRPRELVTRILGDVDAVEACTATRHQLQPQNNPEVTITACRRADAGFAPPTTGRSA
jgi:hypothetical protein